MAKILVIEDDKFLRELINRKLESEKFFNIDAKNMIEHNLILNSYLTKNPIIQKKRPSKK